MSTSLEASSSSQQATYSPQEVCKLSPKQLNFVYGKDPRYWIIPENGPARAVQVLLLSVSGSARVEKGRYRVSFKVSMKDDAFGWDETPVLVAAKVGSTGKFQYKRVKLNDVSSSPMTIPNSETEMPLEIEVGVNTAIIHFGIYELSKRKWKGGLEIHSASIHKITDLK